MKKKQIKDKLSPQRLDIFCKMVAVGRPLQDIAEAIDKNINWLYRHVKEGDTLPKLYKYHSLGFLKLAYDLKAEGCTDENVAARLGYTIKNLQGWRRNLNMLSRCLLGDLGEGIKETKATKTKIEQPERRMLSTPKYGYHENGTRFPMRHGEPDLLAWCNR